MAASARGIELPHFLGLRFEPLGVRVSLKTTELSLSETQNRTTGIKIRGRLQVRSPRAGRKLLESAAEDERCTVEAAEMKLLPSRHQGDTGAPVRLERGGSSSFWQGLGNCCEAWTLQIGRGLRVCGILQAKVYVEYLPFWALFRHVNQGFPGLPARFWEIFWHQLTGSR